MFRKAQDQISCATHFYGAVFAGVTTLTYLVKGWIESSDTKTLVSACIFSLSAAALYGASSLYHYVSVTKSYKNALRKLDHAMIFVLIAGSYTPFVIPYFETKEAIVFLSILWGVALLGIAVKVAWMNAPRVLYTGLYLLMGWAAIFYLPAFISNLSASCMTLVVLGGIFYSVGGIIYIIKKPNISEKFGFHELFHCFILLGTLMHALAVFFCVL